MLDAIVARPRSGRPRILTTMIIAPTSSNREATVEPPSQNSPRLMWSRVSFTLVATKQCSGYSAPEAPETRVR